MKKVQLQTMIGWDPLPMWGIPGSPQKQVTALTMLVPVGWEFNGGPVATQPADCNFTTGRLGFTTSTPDKSAVMVSIPATASLWTNDPSIAQSIHQDNQQYGHIQFCRLEQPQPLAQKIPAMALALSNSVQIAGPMQPVPGVTAQLDEAVRQTNQQLAMQGAQITAEAGRIPVRSTDKSDTGDGYLSVLQVVRAERLPNGATVWTTDYPLQLATSAPAGEYAQYEAMYAAMLDSVWINPEYSQACMQVAANRRFMHQQTKARVNQIHQQMMFDNLNALHQQQAIRADVQNYANHIHTNVAAHRSAALHHSAQQFSLHMGDQTQYYDPTSGGTIQLPSGSMYAWASQTGNTSEYILTDSPSFDPNGQVGSAGWTMMTAVR